MGHRAAWSNPHTTSLPPNSIVLAADNPLFCTGESTTVTISLTDVTDLFGYQFIVHYDPDLVEASAAFTNAFFDTRTNVIIPPDWNAICSNGECKFAASRVDPGALVTGSGAVALVRLNGTNTGTFDLTISDDILTNRDSQSLNHAIQPLHLSVCSYASVSGTVALQGRDTPIDASLVTLTDLGGTFGPYSSSFNPITGAFNFNSVKVLPEGSNYQLEAGHGLYLGNRTRQNLNALEAFSAPPTRLLGGDANNDGTIDLGDLICIGDSFGNPPALCGTTGSSDINADGVVNILDLVLAGGNYGLVSPGTW